MKLKLPRVLAWTVIAVGLAPFQPDNRARADDGGATDAMVADAMPSDGSPSEAGMPPPTHESGGCGCVPVA